MIKVSLPDISSKEINQVKDVFKSNWIVEGPKQNNWKKNLKNLKKNTVFFLILGPLQHLRYLMFKFKKRVRIILPSLSFIATANAPFLSGYKLKFVDVDIDTYNISVQEIEKKSQKKLK